MADPMAASRRGRVVGDYVLGKQIGAGAYSCVWLGRHRVRGTEVAVKEIAVERLSAKLRDCLLSEVDILKRIQHPNIIALHDFVQDGGKIFLILEYCRGGDLSMYIQRHGRVSEKIAKHFMRQLASGLQMLRDNNVVHRDLKPQNILLVANNENSLLKIADFGFAKFLQPFSLAETLCGSPLYMAPEVMQGQKYDAKADLWSIGIILYQLITGRTPYNGNNQIQLLQNILKSNVIHFPSDCKLSNGCIDLCRKLLQRNSVERLTVEEFVNHPFLSEQCFERTLSRAPSDVRESFPFINSSPTRPSGQSSQEDCMPFPLDDELGAQDVGPPILENKSSTKSHGFTVGRKLDKTSGQSPSKNAGLFSRYIMGNKVGPTSQRHDYPSKSNKGAKFGAGPDPSNAYTEDQEYVFVSGPHPEASYSANTSGRQDTPPVAPPKLRALTAPMPINGVAINRQQSAGSLDSHCSPVSGTSQGSVDMGDVMDQPPSDYMTRIRLLQQYASTIADLVKEEVKASRQLEAFSVQLIVLATWKQAMHLCNVHAACATEGSPSQDMNTKGHVADASHPLANSQLDDDLYIQTEGEFLIEVGHAEELATSVGKRADATEMPDGIEIIFQSALQLGRRGGVDEMMGKSAAAVSRYMKAVCMLRFLLIEAPSLALNPPLSLTRSDRLRVHNYIDALTSRLSQLQYQRQ